MPCPLLRDKPHIELQRSNEQTRETRLTKQALQFEFSRQSWAALPSQLIPKRTSAGYTLGPTLFSQSNFGLKFYRWSKLAAEQPGRRGVDATFFAFGVAGALKGSLGLTEAVQINLNIE